MKTYEQAIDETAIALAEVLREYRHRLVQPDGPTTRGDLLAESRQSVHSRCHDCAIQADLPQGVDADANRAALGTLPQRSRCSHPGLDS